MPCKVALDSQIDAQIFFGNLWAELDRITVHFQKNKRKKGKCPQLQFDPQVHDPDSPEQIQAPS